MKDLPDTWSTFLSRLPTLISKWYVICLIWEINSGRLALNFGQSTNDPVLCTISQEEYLLDMCFAAVGYDSFDSSRPISSPAENPTQIKQMFDTVSYDKVCFWSLHRTANGNSLWVHCANTHLWRHNCWSLYRYFNTKCHFSHLWLITFKLLWHQATALPVMAQLNKPLLFLPLGSMHPAHAATLSDRRRVPEWARAIPSQIQLQKCTQPGPVG